MYFIYKNDNDNGFNYLIGIDIMTGIMLPDSPKLINASVPGTGDANFQGIVPFQNDVTNGRIHLDSRTSLLLVNGFLFFGFAHNTDSFPYHGWVFSYRYDTTKHQFVQLAYYCTTPNSGGGGVWQSGHGISSDGKYIYFTTGNGDFNPSQGSMSMAIIKMTFELQVVDYFVPANWKQYSDADFDLGNCGPTLIPNSHYAIVAVTKYGAAHLVDINNMGKFTADKDSCRQTLQIQKGFVTPGGNPVVWDNGKVAKIYTWAPTTPLVQMTFNPATEMLDEPVVTWRSSTTNGGGLFITSNGVNDAILWAYASDAIYAFDASKDVSSGPIWTYKLPGPASFGYPLVVNGKVFTNGKNNVISAFGV